MAENRIADSSWNLFKITTNNENFDETNVDVEAPEDIPEAATPHIDHGHDLNGHLASGHHSDFYLKARAALIIILIMGIVYCVLKLSKFCRHCFASRRQRLEMMQGLPRLEVTAPRRGFWQRRVQDLPPIPPTQGTEPSPSPSSCPSYDTATAPMTPGLSMALIQEMAAAQQALKMARTMTVSPSPRPSGSREIPDMETTMHNLEASIPTAQTSPPAYTPPATQAIPDLAPASPPLASCPRPTAELVQEAAASNPTRASLECVRKTLQ